MGRTETPRVARHGAAHRTGPNWVPILVVVAVIALLAVGVFGLSRVLAGHSGSASAKAGTAQGAPAGTTSSALAKSSGSGKSASSSASAPSGASTASGTAPVEVADPAYDQAVPVLMYHHIMPVPSNFIAISPAMLDAQMKYLHDHGWHPVSMAQLQDFVLTGKRLPSKPVLITFDDGRMNQLTYGVPILKKYGFTATFFVVKKWIVTTSPYFMHEPQLKSLIADGYDVESHTANHMMLYRFRSKSTGKHESYASMKTRMWAATDGMRVWMDETLGGPPVTALAYPGGGNDTFTWELMKEAGYLVAFTTNSGYVTYKGQNQFDLPRWNTGARGTTQATFVQIMTGAERHKASK